MKVCSKCGEMKPLEEFGNEKRTKDGKRAECRDCHKGMRDSWLA